MRTRRSPCSKHKKKLISATTRKGYIPCLIHNNQNKHSYFVDKGIAMEKKEARAEKEEAEKYRKLQDDLVSVLAVLLVLCINFFLCRLTLSCKSSCSSSTTMNVKLMI